jgi:diacylglycerol kinase (ATP)
MIVIYNPTAGRRQARLVWRVLDHLIMAGARVELAETQYPGHAIEIARTAAAGGSTLVIAAGGDGTIAEVASGIAGTRCRLGIIPLGTANVLAHELALPFAPAQLARVLGIGRTCDIWPGIAQRDDGAAQPRGGYFVQMLGVGFDAQVVHSLPLALKRRLGAFAYVLQAMRELARYPFRPIEVQIDGTAYRAGSVVVTKGSLYGGRHLLAPGRSPTRHGFTVALVEPAGALTVLRHALALPLGLLPRMPGLTLLEGSAVTIRTPDMPVQTDGDTAGCAPVVVRETPFAIPVVVA